MQYSCQKHVIIMLKQIFASIVCCVLLQKCIEAQNRCANPNLQNGTCIPLRNCSHLYQLLLTEPLTAENRNFLAQSQCAFRDRTPYVCCVANAAPPNPSNPSNAFTGAGRLSPSDFPPPGACGAHFVFDRIIGYGEITRIDQYPWMALLEYSKPDGSRGFYCGGVLIHQNYVLTASHCVNGEAVVKAQYHLVSVRLGEWDTSTEIDCDDDICAPKPQDIPVTEQITHENFLPNSHAQPDDIALLRLERAATLTEFIRPICLPFEDELGNRHLHGASMNIVGYGKTEYASRSRRKLKAEVNDVPLDKCNCIYNSQNVRISASQVCVGGGESILSHACSGDSGGPLMAEMADNVTNASPITYLIGVASFAPKQCGLKGWPSVYTRVSPYLDWILSHTHP